MKSFEKDSIEKGVEKMKNILITGGPTVEPIDEVMKITNFSTGSLSVNLAEDFLANGDFVCLVVNHIVDLKRIEEHPNLKISWVETTEEMMQAIYEESKLADYDVVIHASAVGDYKAAFTFRMEDLAEELFQKSQETNGFTSPEDILAVMTAPKCKLDDSSKISSYQPNLTVKLGLTPKIILNLRSWFPNAKLIGCKLLENVSKEELFQVATKLCVKNNVDYILANDLADLRRGETARYVVNKAGYTEIKLETPKEIFEFAIK